MISWSTWCNLIKTNFKVPCSFLHWNTRPFPPKMISNDSILGTWVFLLGYEDIPILQVLKTPPLNVDFFVAQKKTDRTCCHVVAMNCISKKSMENNNFHQNNTSFWILLDSLCFFLTSCYLDISQSSWLVAYPFQRSSDLRGQGTPLLGVGKPHQR